jgi:hypothetical protein
MQTYSVKITLSKILWHADNTNELPSELTFTFQYEDKNRRFRPKKPRFVDFKDVDDYFLLDRFTPAINALLLEKYGVRVSRADEYVSYKKIID